MDSKIPRQQQIEQLIQTSAQSREFLTAEVHSLKAKLDVPARVRSSLKGNPGSWMLGSAASGLAASLLFRRKPAKTASKKSAHPIRLLALILTVVRPLAKVWLTGQIKTYLAGGASSLVSANRKSPYRSFQ
jgi:hypothetical protein